MSQYVTWPSLLSTSKGVHYFSFCLNHLQYLFICFVYTSKSIFQMPWVVEYLVFAESHFASIQHNTPNKCFHHMFLQVKVVGSSHEVTFFVESLFSQSNSFSYFMTTSTVLGHQTSKVTKLFHSFQILSTDYDLHRFSFYHRHCHDFSFLHIDSHVVLLWCILQCIHNNL